MRPETPADRDSIRALTTAAFADAPHASGIEAAIIDSLRHGDALTLSLVADDDGAIIGHVAFSPISIAGAATRWFGLGPVSVRSDRRRAGIGDRLIRDGLARLRAAGAQGCVVLGDPAYYGRFGFATDPALRYAGVPPEYFQALPFADAAPRGEVAYHSAFGVA